MLRETLKRRLSVLVVIIMLFSCINISVYAEDEVTQQVQRQDQNRIALDEMLRRNGIDPNMYSDIDFSKGIIPGLESDMFSSYEEYLFEFERRLMAEGPFLLDRIRFENPNMDRTIDPAVRTEAITNSVPTPEVAKENVNRFIIKYKNSDSSDKVNNHFNSKIESTKKFDKEAFSTGNKKGLNKSADKVTKKENVEVMKFNQDITVEDLKQDLESANLYSEIDYIQPDYEINLSSTSSDIDDQWGLLNTTQVSNEVSIDVNVSSAWALSEGDGVTVAVIDSGIDITHQGLVNSIWTNSSEIADNGIDDDGNGLVDDVNGWNFLNDTNAVHNASNSDDELHGTHVSGIIAAQKVNGGGTIGVAPKAKIIPIKVFENGTAYTSDVIEAIQYAEGMGAKVTNCSWGMSQNNQALKDAMANSTMFFVCAAGNGGTNNDNNPIYPASYNLTNVISVASINSNGILSSFSNYGVSTVHVAAPGQNIKSTIPNNLYGQQSGTSMAAPFVSGQAALILAKNTSFTSAQTKNQVIYSSDRLSTLESKVMDGNKVNCENSLTITVNASSTRDVYQIAQTQAPVSNNNDVLSSFSAGDIKQIAAGGEHNLLLMNDGTVYTWGENYLGELGDGTLEDRSTPTMVKFNGLSEGEKIISIAGGGGNSAAVSSEGKVYVWGFNDYGQIGDGTTIQRTIPVLINIPNLGTDEKIISVAVGVCTDIALSNKGKVFAWGQNGSGQIGDGTNTQRTTAVLITIPNLDADDKIISVTAGASHSIALSIKGKVYTWGNNQNGQLGNGTTTYKNAPSLITIPELVTGERIILVAAGYSHSMALSNQGKVYTWGYNKYGQVGDGTTANKIVPTQIMFPELAVGEKLISVAAGIDYSTTLSSEGKVYTWGYNYKGQLGDGTTTNKTIPIQISIPELISGEKIISVVTGFDHCLALSSEGKICSWGYNSGGQLGDGSATTMKTPLQINILGLSTGEKIISVASGYNHSIALSSEGKVYTWGYNYYGQLGDNSTISKSKPILITIPNLVSGEKIISVAAGGYHSIALSNMGKVYTWGYNSDGQLGNGTYTNKIIPIPITISGLVVGEKILSVAAGCYHSIALSSEGKLYTWGYNYNGALGDGTNAKKATPELITIAGLETGEKLTSVVAGYSHCMAITSLGNLYTWGYNNYGQLGDGTVANNTTPTKITITGETITSISAGYSHCMVITNLGNLYAWGYNKYGQLGDGTTTNRTTPTKITITGEQITSIVAGTYHNIAITSLGNLYTWGCIYYDLIAYYTFKYTTTPTKIAMTGESIKMVTATNHNLVLSNSGKVYAWGYNNYGQLGDGLRIYQSSVPLQVKKPKSLSLNFQKDTKMDYALTASNITKPYRYYITYDTSKYEVVDLCKATSAIELTAGYISGTNVVILEHDTTAGLISMAFTDDSGSYTGILDNLLFNAKNNGLGKINVINYAAQ